MNNNKKLIIYFFKILPTCLLSRVAGVIAQLHIPRFLLNAIINWYCKNYKVDREEYLTPESGFKNFDMFFTRKLKKGVHEIDKSKKSVISPVDGRIQEYGEIKGNSILQAKGIDYSLEELIPSDTAREFSDGSFMTIYLSPSDYHRIHSPVNGSIKGYYNIPGKLYTVQEYMVKGYKGLYSINERLISYIQTDNGLVAVCKIGALDVGRITLSYSDVVTNRAFRKREERLFQNDSTPLIKKGDELGIFHIGSTIILLFQKNTIEFARFKTGDRLRVGEVIGKFE
jgi:phosphatidylserine decarboxylase